MTQLQQILYLAANFNGKIYRNVLEKTIFIGKPNAKQQALNKLNYMVQRGWLIAKDTGLQDPQKLYTFTTLAKEYAAENFYINCGDAYFSLSTFRHNSIEMITFYWLEKINRSPVRTTVKEWCKKSENGIAAHSHAPDIFATFKDKKIYVEVETTLKNSTDYVKVFANSRIDHADALLYVFENDKAMKKIGGNMPISDLLHYTTVNMLIDGVADDKLKKMTQKEYLQSLSS